MDLLATVKKEGSRGGRGDFKWSDVQTSSHREHYLGHSIMAPTGRWAKGRDLNWYAKDKSDAADQGSEDNATNERAAEIKGIKEAEQDALARALGLPVPDRSNPNSEAIGRNRDVQKAVKEAAGDEASGAKGIGYSGSSKHAMQVGSDDVERIEGNAEQQDRELQNALKEYTRRHGHRRERRRRSRSRSRSRDREQQRRHRRHRSRQREHRHQPRSRPRSRGDARGRYSTSPERDGRRYGRRDRSYSPAGRYDDRDRHERSHARRY